MKRTKVLTVVGTRPEIIRLSRVMARLDESLDHVLVHTGQNYDYELNQIFFEDLEIRRPDHFLEAAGGSAAETIGQVISRTDAVLAHGARDGAAADGRAAAEGGASASARSTGAAGSARPTDPVARRCFGGDRDGAVS